MWCWHKYSKWIDVESGRIADSIFSKMIKGHYTRQESRCKKCNIVQVRIIRVRIPDDEQLITPNDIYDHINQLSKDL